ncbi:hypothetical protein FRB94_012320 [Tulasnella sp. JGI-2019a]|nr:hypothetical protein FRB94_012320 [Tulasnella sp. JGI-2019a]KAG9016428.1 hypothetical protein FRB93_010677 [Tulasnella sp. JGI-2019a]
MEIGVELSEDLATELAESIVSAFQLPENNEFARVTVSVPCVTVSRSMVIPILRNSLSVWRLVLQSMDLLQPREPDVVLEFLAKPVVLGGVTRWPAPKLKVLVLGSSPDNLLDMVIRRYGRAGDAGEPGQSVERPLPLRVLQILSPITIATGPLVEELTRILGEGVVLWEESRGVRLDPADLDDWEGSGAKAFDGEISDNPFGSSGM